MLGSMYFFGGLHKFSNGHCDLILLLIFFILISINIKVLLIFPNRFSQIYLAVHEKKSILLVAIFSNGSHLEFSTD